jgi:hypothetical protein
VIQHRRSEQQWTWGAANAVTEGYADRFLLRFGQQPELVLRHLRADLLQSCKRELGL